MNISSDALHAAKFKRAEEEATQLLEELDEANRQRDEAVWAKQKRDFHACIGAFGLGMIAGWLIWG